MKESEYPFGRQKAINSQTRINLLLWQEIQHAIITLMIITLIAKLLDIEGD